MAASGVNGEDDNCGGGDDVHGERELGRKAAREGGREAEGGGAAVAVAMVAAAEGKNCWSGKEERRLTVGAADGRQTGSVLLRQVEQMTRARKNTFPC